MHVERLAHFNRDAASPQCRSSRPRCPWRGKCLCAPSASTTAKPQRDWARAVASERIALVLRTQVRLLVVLSALRHFADTFILPSICCMRCHGCMSAVHASAWVLVGPQGLPAVDPHLTGGSDSARLSHGGLCGDARSLLPLRTAESHGPSA